MPSEKMKRRRDISSRYLKSTPKRTASHSISSDYSEQRIDPNEFWCKPSVPNKCQKKVPMKIDREECNQSISLKAAVTYSTYLIVSILIVSHNVVVASTQTADGQSGEPAASASDSSSQQSTAATCFGGLQTFEKISMSAFESPTANGQSSSGSSFGSGILVQQDDQALTSECVNLCRSQSNCLSFVIDYNKFECKSYATTQQELQQEFDAKFQQSERNVQQQTNDTSNLSNSTNDGRSYLLSSAASTVHFQHLLPSASSNYFEKICLDGVANRNQFGDVCGQNRLWTIERVLDSFLDGYVEKEVTNVNNKDECSKLCIFETQFVCRSADYDQQSRLCRLSKEDRRTQPQAMRYLAGSNRQYLENQCATPGPSSCVYETKKNLGIISMDALKFAQTIQDCQMKCNLESTFNCRSYSFHQQRCFLSGDDSSSLNSNLIKLPMKQGWSFGEKKCLVELCTKGIFSYEKITGYTLRSALTTTIDLMMAGSSLHMLSGGYESDQDRLQQLDSTNHQASYYQQQAGSRRNGRLNSTSDIVSTMMMLAANNNYSQDPLSEAAATPRHSRSTSNNNLAITNHCRHSCDLGYLNCPAFTIDYKNNRCQRLDRNSQGRHHELVAREGFAYYEKICLRVPEIMTMCQDKYWIFERVIGYELAPRFYDKSLKFVQSRRDCEEYCLEEKQFQCRSALYNDETSDCKLSRYDRRLANLEGGYQRNFNVRISYLENQCIRDHRTLLTSQSEVAKHQQLQCYYEQARDDPSYPTFTEHIEMVPVPSTSSGQNSMVEKEMSTGGGDRLQGNKFPGSSSSSAYCEQLCNENSKFECHSFGYYASTAQCFLSGDDTTSAGDSASTLSTGFTYYEKKCRFNSMIANNSSNPEETMPPKQVGPENPYFQPPRQPTPSNSTAIDPKPNAPGNYDEPPRPFKPTSRPVMPTMTTINVTNEMNLHNNQSFNSDPDKYKCGIGHTFVYQRISGFEPIGGYLTILIKNNEQPGIVADCAELCKKAYECRAFVVDYNSNQCYAMLENSQIGLLSLRQTLGKDYFEGFCAPDYVLAAPTLSSSSDSQGNHQCGNKTWIMDKIVDQAVVGVQHQKLIPDMDRVQCRLACLEERLFYCKSAMFDSMSKDCKLYSIDRESMPQMRLLFTKGIDFYENQCQIKTNVCPYDAIERDMTIVSVTKSLQARSTFDCEFACDSETTFNCRSYTYLDQYPSLPNLCLLSSDSRSTSQKGSVHERQRTLYAERNCYYRRPRFPGGQISQQPPFDALSHADPYAKLPQGVRLSSGHSSHIDNYAPVSGGNKIPTEDVVELSQSPGSGPCEPHQFTFERTFGYDYRLGQKERAPIAPTIGIAIGCQQECLRRAERCQSFVVEYGLPYQGCFLIDTQVGANKKLLVKSPNSAYFEKVCLPRTGIELQETPPTPLAEPLTHSHMTMIAGSQLDMQSMDIAPSYSNEPWSPQLSNQANANQLPYNLLQQQLIQNYPSRTCAKLWSFERFMNHNFTIQSDKLIENCLTKAQCEGFCLNEASFSCRAATYDYSSKICRLFKNTRRTVMSQFVNLEQQQQATPIATSSSATQSSLSPGTVQVINSEAESIYGSASTNSQATTINENAGSLNKRQGSSRQIGAVNQQDSIESARNIDYLENTCTPEPSSCQYRQLYDLFSPYIDKIQHAVSLSDCQRQCDLERLFGCKSINYDPTSRNCMLINEDLISLNRGASQQQQSGLLLSKKNTIYSEKGNCEMISVQCNSQEMLVSINFDSPFKGRVMAKGNPEQCYLIGDGQTSLQFPIVFGPKCNSRQEGHNTFVNEVVIQQHPVIMTDSDKTIRVMCAFEAPDQTITLKNPSSRDNKTGIDVGTSDTGRTRHDKQQFNSVVSNKAAPPSVLLRILDMHGRDASMINLGDDLILKIQMQMDGQNSALGIFARNLAAKSSNGESLLLIDNDGCPVDHQVFPGLEIDPKDGKSLYSTFKAFRFPSSGLVNFEVQIRFCPERCQPVDCSRGLQKMRSYGRRKRDVSNEDQTQSARTSVLQSVDNNRQKLETSLDSLSTVMKPGKAFQYVRELMMIGNGKSTETEPSSEESKDKVTDASMENSFNQSSGETQLVTSQPDYANPSTEINQFFEGQTAPPEAIAPIGSQTLQPDFSNNRQQVTNEFVVNVNDPETKQMMQPATVNQLKQETSLSQPILMHVAEKVVPNTDSAYPLHIRGIHPINNAAAPYGRFPLPIAIELHHRQPSITTTATTTTTTTGSPMVTHDDELAKQPTFNNQLDEQSGYALTKESHTPQLNDSSSLGPVGSGKESSVDKSEMPLRFSILVGENQNGANNDWTPGTGPAPSVLVMNSSKVDLDHIVVPGKDGQFFEEASSFNVRHTSQNSNEEKQSEPNGRPSQHAKTKHNTALIEQALDPQPSNSIATEASELNHRANKNHSQVITLNQSLQSAASHQHDCQSAGGGSKLWTIVWTGAFVICLNVCFVVLSLFLYFKRSQFRPNHEIIRTTSSDCGTHSSSGLAGHHRGAGRWPSVLLKSKNNLGTSLNTHEHFFCKLNSKQATSSKAILGNDYQWPNLSSSSLHSTISSLANTSPKPAVATSIVRINQSAYRQPYDSHASVSSIQSQGNNLMSANNFNRRSILDNLNSYEVTHEPLNHANYTNNIDESQPNNFDVMR